MLSPAFAYAQQDTSADFAIARQYRMNGEFDKALPLFQQLWNSQPDDILFYKGLYNCMLNLKKYDDGIKLVKKQMKRNPSDATLFVDLGNIYKTENDLKNETASFDAAIDHLASNAAQIGLLANAFDEANENDYVIKVYLKARDLLSSPEGFTLELASAYAKENDATSAIRYYLDALETTQADETQIENKLQSNLTDAKYRQELQMQLYKRIQKDPDNNTFPDLLVWLYVQQNDYADAFIQVKAIDRRNHEDGARVFRFAQNAYDEGEYDVAIQADEYLITEKGNQSQYYLPAKSDLLETYQTKISVDPYTTADLQQLEKLYQDYFTEFGKNEQTLYALRNYASFEARYQNNLTLAIATLQQTIKLPAHDDEMTAECKLDLGDYLLMNNQPWDASLTYAQVDKAFADAPVGEEARFKNAKFWYYMGEFDLSKAQLDILKAATSQLVAIDAIALSVFMTDNMGMDTNKIPMQIFARADLLAFQNKNDDALKTLDSLTTEFPQHALNDDAIYKKGLVELQKKDFAAAAIYFQQVDSAYSTDLLGDEALFTLAKLYENQLNNKAKAMDLYKELLFKYKGSLYLAEARRRFRELRGDATDQ
jgi:tetratricopeptide (TPR) repeat protein